MSSTRGPGRVGSGTDLQLVAEQAAAATALPVELLGNAVPVLATAATGAPVGGTALGEFGALGAQAARSGFPLADVLGLYLAASWQLWPLLGDLIPRVDEPPGPAALRGMQQLLHAVSAGHDDAQRRTVLQDEARHREFVHDLLTGSGDADRLATAAAEERLRLSGAHRVAVLATDRVLLDFGPVAADIDAGLRARLAGGDFLVASKDGLLAVLLPEAATGLVEFLDGRVRAVEPARQWRICVSRRYPGLAGVRRGWREARQTLTIARRLNWPTSVATAADVSVYALLLRDEEGLAALAEEVLGPLRRARGGPQPLLDTLQGFFEAAGNAAATARAEHLSVRAVLYRLERIEQLTGLRLDDPRARLQLQLAVAGTSLLGWPDVPVAATQEEGG